MPCISGTLFRTKSLKQPCQLVQVVHKKSFHKCQKLHRMGYCTFWNLVLNMASLLWHFGRSLVMISWVDDVYGVVDPSDSFTGLSLGDSKSFGLLIFHWLQTSLLSPYLLLVSNLPSPFLLWHTFIFALHLWWKVNEVLIQCIFPKDNSRTRCVR